MSVGFAAAAARVAEIEALVGRTRALPAQPATPPAGFAAQLAAASSPLGAPATAPATGGAGGSTPYDSEIAAAAARHGVDPAVLKGLIEVESGFNPRAGSPAGAQGLTQLMPGTAASLGVSDPFDPAQAIDGGARYLRQMLDRFGGDVSLALAGYNAGPGAVQRHGGIPPYAETRAYVQKVLTAAEKHREAPAASPVPSIAPSAGGALPYSTN